MDKYTVMTALTAVSMLIGGCAINVGGRNNSVSVDTSVRTQVDNRHKTHKVNNVAVGGNAHNTSNPYPAASRKKLDQLLADANGGKS